MAIEVIDHGSVREIVIAEEFRRKLPDDLRRVLGEALARPNARVCVNLQGIMTTISSAALEVLLGASRELEGRGERLALCGISDAVSTILDLTRIKGRFRIVRTCAELTGDDDVFVLEQDR